MTKFLSILALPFVLLKAIWDVVWDVVKDIPRDLKYSVKGHWRKWKHWYHHSYWEDDVESPSDKIDRLHE